MRAYFNTIFSDTSEASADIEKYVGDKYLKPWESKIKSFFGIEESDDGDKGAKPSAKA